MAVLVSRIPQLISWLTSGLDFHFVLLLTLVALVPFAVIKQILKIKSLPPGPWGLPIVGMLVMINKEFHLMLTDFSKKFGKILSFKMGGETIVVLSDSDIIKKAFKSRDFVARPKTELSSLLGGYGVINSEGDLWKSQRRFLLNQKLGMKHWGQGMEQIESCVQNEVVYFLDNISINGSKPINPAGFLNCALSNVICSIIMSTRFRHDDPKFQRFMFLFDEGFRLFTVTGAMTFLPFLKHLPTVNDACQQLKKNRDEMLMFVRDIISEHKANLDSQNPKDLIDSYLVEINRLKQSGKEEEFLHGFDPENQLEQIVLDLFSAGVETLKTSMLWSIIYMLHFPEVKAKVQQEIEQVVGKHRTPTTEDMANLPYTRATLYEVMRRSSVVPMGTTHSTTRAVEFEGYTIPKNAQVIPLLHAVHMNPEIWENPEDFKPERFLNEEGQTFKPEHFMPFGSGQRMCLGDKLAEKEFFLFFTSMLHVFDIQNPSGELPSLRGIAAVTVTPTDFDVIFTVRNEDALISALKSKGNSTRSLQCRTFG